MKIDTLHEGVTEWGEGAIWHKETLYYVDIEGQAILSCGEMGENLRRHEVEFQPATLVPVRGGGFLCAGEGGIYHWDGKGSPVLAVNPEPNRPNQRLNDGKCSPDGLFFVGSINPQRKPEASLYCYDAEGKIKKVLDGVANSNGLGWSPDGGTMYHIDTPTRKVTCFDYTAGELSNRRDAFSTAQYDASPDGMAVDEAGNLWIAMCHAGCVVCFSPQGTVLNQVDLPCREVSSCAFGGENRDLLYITTGIPGNDKEPLAGRLFVVKELGVRGLPSNVYGKNNG